MECHKIGNTKVKQFFRNGVRLCKKGDCIMRGERFKFNVKAAALERFNEMARLATGKDEAGQVSVGFHGAPERLLADQGESVSVIHENEAKSIRAGVDPLTESGNLVSNRVNTPILFAA